MKIPALIVSLLIFSYCLYAQDIRQLQINLPPESTDVAEFMLQIEQNENVKFFFKKNWLKDIKPYSIGQPVSLMTFLDNTFQTAGISYIIRDRYIILYQKNYESINLENKLRNEEDLLVIGENNAPLDKKVLVKGKVVDGLSGGVLPGAVVKVKETGDGVVTNAEGIYSMRLYPGLYTINVNFVGFEETISKVFIKDTGEADLTLFESSLELDAVTIEEFAIDQNVNSAQVSVTNLDMKTIKSIPALLGEADIVKSILLLPGVSTVGEGSTGFNVRGGATDQNLLIYDRAPIFNPSHLFGFFSNINPDAVKDVTLYKGGIPARFGGRASSVLEINSRNPDMEELQLKGGVGLISSRLTADIPLIKNKSALLIGGRASYINWLLDRVKNVEIRRSRAQFYDFNAKWTMKVSDKDFVSVSGYLSNDDFKFAADTVYGWQTRNLNASWVHVINDKLSTEVSLAMANYSYQVDGEVPTAEYRLNSDIGKDLVSGTLFWNPVPAHSIVAGVSVGSYQFNIGDLQPLNSESVVLPITLESERAIEQAIFIQDEYTINSRVSVAAGLRFTNFDNLGPGEVFEYRDDETRSAESVIGTTVYEDGELIQRYNGLEPRLSFKYGITGNSSLKFGYNRMRQYIHTITNTAAVTPIDVWKPSDRYLAPKIADQVSAGYFRNFRDNVIEASAEVYYKTLQNEIDYKNGASILLNGTLERVIVSGRGRSYGLELFLKKNKGRLSGWLSYTLSRTEKQIAGDFAEEVINDGNYYAAEYDKPHNLSVVMDYKLSNRWKINANFTYSSGRPFTGPDVRFRYNGQVLTYFANRNQFRIPDYHRLDLSITMEPGLKKEKLLDGSWTLSFYNIYGRENAYSVFIGERNTSSPTAYKFSILGSVFPSLSYNFEL
ncbi:MAG: carboxypeptidase-like regulatory domain-containing protein [Cyclobacteriaceae bacterium]